MIELQKELSATSYPGRGIVLGKSDDGKKAVIAYFIMGRSENSRNRIFEPTEDGIRTKAFDAGRMVDPSLIIYSPVRVWREQTIVTNGDQTDTIYEGFEQGLSFEQSLRSRTFEPDAPNYTPRISGLWKPKADTYHLSILKSADGDPESVQRFFFDYVSTPAGRGHFIHTYAFDGDPLPSFAGEPTPVTIEGEIDAFTSLVWKALNAENRVSLFTRFIDLQTGAEESRIVNKHEGN